MMSLQTCKVIIVLVCVTATVHGSIHEIKQQGNGKFKISMVIDSTLQQALGSLSRSAGNVKELDLSGNVLRVISGADLQQFYNLEWLNLSSNVLYETVDLGSLPKLRTVDLNNNNIQEVVLGSSVQTLYAANNNISRVTCNGPSQGGGKKLYLANNKIGSLLDLNFVCRNGLEELDLKLNVIKMVDFGELTDSSNSLKYLDLRHNFIFDIKNQRNVVFPQLQKLDVSWNKLAYLGKELNAASSATWIDFSNNKLVLIDKEKLLFTGRVQYFNLLGNGFHCGTLKDFFKRHQSLVSIATSTVRQVTGQNKEVCATDTTNVPGPFCCDYMSVPFADRLIALKLKEHALLPGIITEKELQQCKNKNGVQQREIETMKKKYRLKVNEITLKKQEKILLEKEKEALEVKNHKELRELRNELENAAQELQLNEIQNLNELQLLEAIVKKYDAMYQEQQIEQNNAIRDWDMYQQKETKLAEENERLRNINEAADTALANANETLQDLNEQLQELETLLENSS